MSDVFEMVRFFSKALIHMICVFRMSYSLGFLFSAVGFSSSLKKESGSGDQSQAGSKKEQEQEQGGLEVSKSLLSFADFLVVACRSCLKLRHFQEGLRQCQEWFVPVVE